MLAPNPPSEVKTARYCVDLQTSRGVCRKPCISVSGAAQRDGAHTYRDVVLADEKLGWCVQGLV